METLLDQTLTIPFDDDDSPPPEHREGWLLVRIHVPELNVSKCLQFPTERLVWDVKQQVLASLPKVLHVLVVRVRVCLCLVEGGNLLSRPEEFIGSL